MANAIARKWLAVTLVLLALGFSPLAHSLCVSPHATTNHIHEMFDPMGSVPAADGAQAMAGSMGGSMAGSTLPAMNLAATGEIVLYLAPALVIFFLLLLSLQSRQAKRCTRRCLTQRRLPAFEKIVWPPAPPDLNALCISRV